MHRDNTGGLLDRSSLLGTTKIPIQLLVSTRNTALSSNEFISNDKTGHPIYIYFFKVDIKNTRKRCEICSKLTIKTTERRYLWTYFTPFSSVSIVDFLNK